MASECGRRKQRIQAVEDAILAMRVADLRPIHIAAIKGMLRTNAALVETNSRLYKDNVKLRRELNENAQ